MFTALILNLVIKFVSVGLNLNNNMTPVSIKHKNTDSEYITENSSDNEFIVTLVMFLILIFLNL